MKLDSTGAGRHGCALLQLFGQGQRAGQQGHHLLDTGHGVGVGPLDIARFVAVQPGVGHYLDVVAQVVEYQDGLAEHEHRFRHALGVFGHLRHARLEVADGVVGHVAHRAAVEAGQAVHGDELVPRHLVFHQRQRVNLAVFLAGAGGDDPVRVGADEAVTAQDFPALHALQQVGVGAAGNFQVGGYRGF